MPKQFSQSEKQPIGLLGCGLVGASLAKRMVAAGWSVWAYDPAPGARERIEATGAGWLDSEAAVAARCGCLLFSLPGSAEVAVVVQRILPVLPPGSVIVDTTTGDPEAVEATARERGFFCAADRRRYSRRSSRCWPAWPRRCSTRDRRVAGRA